MGGKCQNSKIQMRHFEEFSNNVNSVLVVTIDLSGLSLSVLIVVMVVITVIDNSVVELMTSF